MKYIAKLENEYYEDFYLKPHHRKFVENLRRYIELPVEDISIYCNDDAVQKVDSAYEDKKQRLHGAIKQLTNRQQKIINMYLENKSQQEIADTLNSSQCNVHFAIHGNKDYSRGKTYGGIINKLKSILIEDQVKIQPKPVKPKLKVICKCCNREFETSSITLKRCSVCRKRKAITIKCNNCNKEFKSLNRRIKYCPGCKVIKKDCVACGKTFTTNEKNQKYCSRECRLLKKNCITCGKTFTTNKKYQKYCSRECYMKKRSEKKYW